MIRTRSLFALAPPYFCPRPGEQPVYELVPYGPRLLRVDIRSPETCFGVIFVILLSAVLLKVSALESEAIRGAAMRLHMTMCMQNEVLAPTFGRRGIAPITQVGNLVSELDWTDSVCEMGKSFWMVGWVGG
jgi:hypothetical protein